MKKTYTAPHIDCQSAEVSQMISISILISGGDGNGIAAETKESEDWDIWSDAE